MDEHNYSESSGKLECAICSEHIFDPRVLPCGHSYCGGKSKTCLNALKVENGLKCALCNDVHEIEISSLKPLFGIRDIVHRSYTQSPCPQEQYVDHVDGIEASSSASPANKMMGPKCENHFCNPIKFWCVECSQFICETCFEETHQSHSLKSYRCYLQDTVKEKLCSIHSVEAIIEENVEKCGKKRNILQTEMSEIDEFQTLLAEKRSLMTVVKENKEKLRMFGDGTMTDIDRSLVDTFMSVTSSICDLQFPRLETFTIASKLSVYTSSVVAKIQLHFFSGKFELRNRSKTLDFEVIFIDFSYLKIDAFFGYFGTLLFDHFGASFLALSSKFLPNLAMQKKNWSFRNQTSEH